MYSFNSNLKKEEYDKFVENYSMASFMQDYNWANVKDNWKSFHCGLYKNKKLVGVCLILVKKLLKNLNVFYIPRGYLIDFENLEDLREMTKNVKSLAKKNKAYMIKIDPNFCISDNGFKTSDVEHNYSNNFDIKHKNLLTLGYKYCGIQKDIHKNFQPQYNIFAPMCDTSSNILTKEEVLKHYNRIKSYMGAYQEKRGVSFHITDDISEVDKLVYLLKQTEKKQHINLRNKEYFLKIMKNYKGYSYLVFGSINLDKYKSFLEKENKLDLINEVEELKKEHGNVLTLSGALILLPKNKKGIRTSEYLYAGNNLNLNKLHVSTALVFEIIKFSIENNCHYCNLGGVNGTLDDRLTKFKQNFNGRIMEFAGEYDLPVSPIYYPIKLLYPIALKVYRKLKK